MVSDDIIMYMRAAIGDPNCRAMSFVAVEGQDYRVTIAGVSAPKAGFPDAYVQLILLQTADHVMGSEPEPPSTGEDPPGEDIPDPDTAVGNTKAAKKKVAKKASKKAAKKKKR